MNRYILSVSSAGGKPLNATENDAASVHALFMAKRIGFCHKKSPLPLLACTTARKFNDMLDDCLKDWDPQDQLILYYSGHGQRHRGKYCLVLGDGKINLVSFSSLLEKLSFNDVDKSIIILDACGAGDATKGDGGDETPLLTPDVDKTKIPSGMAIIASSGPAQFSWENEDRDASRFTEALVQILHDGIDNGEQYVFVDEIVEAVQRQLDAASDQADKRQNPIFLVRGEDRLWLARNSAYRSVEQEEPPVQTDEVYLLKELAKLVERKLSEEAPSKPGSIEDLDWELIASYRIRATMGQRAEIDDPSKKVLDAQLVSSELIQNQRVANRSAALCFCNSPENFHPESLTIFFEPKSGTDDFVRREFGGPLVRQLRKIQDVVASKLEVISYVDANGDRQERAEVDLDVLREVLANAMVHRDFSINGNVDVRVTPTHVEVSNPGSLLRGSDFKTVLENTFRSVPQNPLLMLFMNRLGRTEQVGRGFRLIREYRQKYGVEALQCIESEGPVTVFQALRLRPLPTGDSNLEPSSDSPTNGASGPSPLLKSAGKASPIFDVPHSRNPWFTGREELLSELARRLNDRSRIALAEVIKGLGGVGKTQTAIEFAYRYRTQYDAVFWIPCESESELTNQFSNIAARLQLPHDDSQPKDAIRAVRQWLENHGRWLLIFDNVDDPNLLTACLPKTVSGHVLVTSRSLVFTVLGITDPFELSTLSHAEAITFLLSRTNRKLDSNEALAAAELATALGELPLALEQAAAYIAEMDVTFGTYLSNYQQHHLDLLEHSKPIVGSYPESVANTWSVNLEQVEGMSLPSADLLRFSAFVSPDRIPFELPRLGATELGDVLSAHFCKTNDGDAVEQLLMPLSRFALIGRNRANESYSVHRLVQEVIRHSMSEDIRRIWAKRSVEALGHVFPAVKFSSWAACRRLLPHAVTGADLIRRYGITSPLAGQLVYRTGYFLSEQGLYAEAEPLYKQATEISRTALGEDHPDFATSLNNLASLYQAQGRYTEAEPLYKQAADIRSSVLGESHPNFAASVNNLAGLYYSQGRYEEAEPLYKQAAEITKAALGEDHPSFATSLSNLASLYMSQARYAEARPLCREVVEVIKTALGEDHPDFATSLNNLAGLYFSQCEYEEAEPLYKHATEIIRTALGEDHPSLATSYNNLALLYETTGRHEDAESLYKQSTEIIRTALGENHPSLATSYSNLARLYEATGRHKDAESLYKQSTEIRRAALGESHPDFATSLNNLADLYQSQDRYKDAEPLYKQATEIRRATFGEGHPNFKRNLQRYADLLRKMNRDSEAVELESKQ